jgi:hypothetical protein
VAAADKKELFRFTRPPRAGSFMRWLDGGQNPALQGAWKRQASKEGAGIEIIFPGLIDDAELPVSRCVPIGQDLVDLAPFQRHFIALVAKTEYELAFR